MYTLGYVNFLFCDRIAARSANSPYSETHTSWSAAVGCEETHPAAWSATAAPKRAPPLLVVWLVPLAADNARGPIAAAVSAAPAAPALAFSSLPDYRRSVRAQNPIPMTEVSPISLSSALSASLMAAAAELAEVAAGLGASKDEATSS